MELANGMVAREKLALSSNELQIFCALTKRGETKKW